MAGCIIELWEPRSARMRRFLGKLVDYYHFDGYASGWVRNRLIAGVVTETHGYVDTRYIVAVAVLQDARAWDRALRKLLITENGYFLRRVVRTVPRCLCGDVLVQFLRLLAEKLRSEGKEVLVTMGYPDHSNALYEHAGFHLVGYTRENRLPVYVLDLTKLPVQAVKRQ